MTPVEATLVYCAVPLLSEAEKLFDQGKHLQTLLEDDRAKRGWMTANELCFGTHARGRRG